jgi:hypothetical protein
MTREQYEYCVELYDMVPPTFERAQMLERNQYSGTVFAMVDALWLDHVNLCQMGAYDPVNQLAPIDKALDGPCLSDSDAAG